MKKKYGIVVTAVIVIMLIVLLCAQFYEENRTIGVTFLEEHDEIDVSQIKSCRLNSPDDFAAWFIVRENPSDIFGIDITYLDIDFRNYYMIFSVNRKIRYMEYEKTYFERIVWGPYGRAVMSKEHYPNTVFIYKIKKIAFTSEDPCGLYRIEE